MKRFEELMKPDSVAAQKIADDAGANIKKEAEALKNALSSFGKK